MQPRLLLALALLGAASAGPPAPAPLHPPEVPAGPARGVHQFRYAVVTVPRTYAGAQRHCRGVLGGQLASLHSAAGNQGLLRLTRTYTRLLRWIGAVTDPTGESRWADGNPWNYANWAPTHPRYLFATCTTLSPFDGLCRSTLCSNLHPFICQY